MDKVKLAEWLHDNYEELAKANDWQTQEITRVKFDDLPQANKNTMLALADRLHNTFLIIARQALVSGQLPLPSERFDAEDWLGEHKDIWNHPRVTDRNDKESYEVADLMAEFANWYYGRGVAVAANSCIGALRQPGGQPKPKNLTMPNQQTPAPMSKEEILKKHGIYPGFRSTYTYEAILSAMDEYRLAFEKEQHQPSDPYWSDPATWPEWANWRAVGEDGCVYFASILMEANTLYGSWSTSIYAASKMVPRAVTHNPNWRNSLRSREEVSDGK